VPARLEEAVGLALVELARRRREGERVVLVAPDPAIATSLGRLVDGGPWTGNDAARPAHDPEIVHLAALEDRLEAGPVDAVVVLGALPTRPVGRPVVQLAVAPLGPLGRPFAERSLRLGRLGPDGRGPRRALERPGDRPRPWTAPELGRTPGLPSVTGRLLGG
jgi:hypothetical protein